MADAADRAGDVAEALSAYLLRLPVLCRAVDASRACLSCGEAIPDARLRAVPGCCLCVECQEDAEKAMGR